MQSQLTGEDFDTGKVWRQKEQRAAEGEVVRQHHQLNRHEFAQTQGDREDKGD